MQVVKVSLVRYERENSQENFEVSIDLNLMQVRSCIKSTATSRTSGAADLVTSIAPISFGLLCGYFF